MNPGNETFGQLWKRFDENGFAYHERFAVVGWPASADIKCTFKLMGDVAATEMALSDNHVDIAKVNAILQYRAEQGRQNAYAHGYIVHGNSTPMVLQLCQKMCKALADSGDVTYIATFFKTCFSRVREKREMTSVIADLIRKVGWGQVGDPYLRSIDHYSIPHADRVEFLLSLADALENNSAARTSLTKAAVERARSLSNIKPSAFAGLSDVDRLWKHAIACGNLSVFNDTRSLFMEMNGKFLKMAVISLSTLVKPTSLPEHKAALSSLASRRRAWLVTEIASISRPFTYELPSADAPGAAELTAFLRGPDSSFIVRGFTSIAQARYRVAQLTQTVQATGLSITAEGRGQKSYVRLVKGGAGFDHRKHFLPTHKAEIMRLDRVILSGMKPTVGNKRARDEASGNFTIH